MGGNEEGFDLDGCNTNKRRQVRLAGLVVVNT
jgi:hypothetical protein